MLISELKCPVCDKPYKNKKSLANHLGENDSTNTRYEVFNLKDVADAYEIKSLTQTNLKKFLMKKEVNPTESKDS